ncbi:hypothetical protein [Piscinibacter sp.]|uniref:hypothetical protein n=1 Tax=Piscinibacter sp. TaxID=1903157 RepID=UPI002C4048D1|nr:hypothetical protein [Albitalea sp.]HUG24144.1 hypothetical protein [Albitalea sp.]
MPSLLGCLLIGIAMGLLSHLVRSRARGESLSFTCVVATCGGVLGGLVAAPLLGLTSEDVAHLTFAEAAGAAVASAVLLAAMRLFPLSARAT